MSDSLKSMGARLARLRTAGRWRRYLHGPGPLVAAFLVAVAALLAFLARTEAVWGSKFSATFAGALLGAMLGALISLLVLDRIAVRRQRREAAEIRARAASRLLRLLRPYANPLSWKIGHGWSGTTADGDWWSTHLRHCQAAPDGAILQAAEDYVEEGRQDPESVQSFYGVEKSQAESLREAVWRLGPRLPPEVEARLLDLFQLLSAAQFRPSDDRPYYYYRRSWRSKDARAKATAWRAMIALLPDLIRLRDDREVPIDWTW